MNYKRLGMYLAQKHLVNIKLVAFDLPTDVNREDAWLSKMVDLGVLYRSQKN